MTHRQQAKRRGDIKYIGKPCAIHGSALRYTESGKCVECRAGKRQNQRESVDGHCPRAYYLGQWARNRGAAKSAPGELSVVMRYWWLAGWNDADIRLCTT